MNAEVGKCKCGCGETPIWGIDYVSGHDLIHRSKLIERAGGVDSLDELLTQIDRYMNGDIAGCELTKVIRRVRVR
jgi:hypothetical protein